MTPTPTPTPTAALAEALRRAMTLERGPTGGNDAVIHGSLEDAAAAILAALPEAVRYDGHKGHWKLTLWWDREPAPPIFIEDDS